MSTRVAVWVVSLLLQVGVAWLGGTGFSVQDVPLMVVNAFLVALAAMGAYDDTFAKLDSKG